MNYYDLGNALMEVIGCVFLSFNVRRILIDKHVAGVSAAPAVFYFTWGVYNCFYYAYLHQQLSFLCGFLTTGAHAVWIFFYLKYLFLSRKLGSELRHIEEFRNG